LPPAGAKIGGWVGREVGHEVGHEIDTLKTKLPKFTSSEHDARSGQAHRAGAERS
jgi:hypothetical protein